MPSKRHPGKPSGNGKGLLQRAVSEEGFSRRKAAAAVDAVINAWKTALARGEEVETPVGHLRVVKRKSRFAAFKLKHTKRRLCIVNQRPRTVQLVSKVDLDPSLPSCQVAAPAAPDVPATSNLPTNATPQFRPMHIAHVSFRDRDGIAGRSRGLPRRRTW